MLKSCMFGMLLSVGTITATVMEKVDIRISGVHIITDGNTARIPKKETWFFVSRTYMNPVLRTFIRETGGKPSDMLVAYDESGLSVLTEFTKIHVPAQHVPHKVYKNCIGFIANEDGSYDYFCRGLQAHELGYVINTQMNTVGIADNDVCYLTKDKKSIKCLSGTVFANPLQRESALTGTPGHLSSTNYIGFMVSKPSTPSLMGSGKRIDFFAR